ncbi:hypothetical protein C1646_720554 [Rhizophagus diaphanus]|nr:hypothetical protein C1646_720554 [Rhizophagus diaphanus] [Rhizophagus sp. MUCL 43196]
MSDNYRCMNAIPNQRSIASELYDILDFWFKSHVNEYYQEEKFGYKREEIDIEERKTDGEISFDSSKIKRKFIPVRAPSVVWQYFEKLYDDNGVHSQSRCNFCGKNYSAGCATTTLNYHWECKHKHSKVQPGGTRSIEMAFNNSEKQVKSKGGEHLEVQSGDTGSIEMAVNNSEKRVKLKGESI